MQRAGLGAIPPGGRASRAGSSSTCSRLLLRSPFFALNCNVAKILISIRTRSSRSPSPARPRRVSQPSSRTSQSTARGMDVASCASARGEVPPPPKELAEWAGNTAAARSGDGVRRGARVQGARPAVRGGCRDRREEAPMDARHVGGDVLGGLRLGSFVAVFARCSWRPRHRADGARDMWDTVAAGAGTAGATGLALPGGVRMKDRTRAFVSGCASRWGTSRRVGPVDTTLRAARADRDETSSRATPERQGRGRRAAAPRDGPAAIACSSRTAGSAPRKKNTWFPPR